MHFYELIRIAWDFEFDYVQTKMKFFKIWHLIICSQLMTLSDGATRYLILY